jgi:hypothetical protein
MTNRQSPPGIIWIDISHEIWGHKFEKGVMQALEIALN